MVKKLCETTEYQHETALIMVLLRMCNLIDDDLFFELESKHKYIQNLTSRVFVNLPLVGATILKFSKKEYFEESLARLIVKNNNVERLCSEKAFRMELEENILNK